MRRFGIAAASFALVTGCSAAPAATPTAPATFDVKGTIAVTLILFDASDGDPCTTTGGYDDIRTGTQVKVSDASGKIVGLGALSSGLARDTDTSWRGTNKCEFSFSVTGIPEGGEIFGVEVSHRGVVQFTRNQADQVALTLG